MLSKTNNLPIKIRKHLTFSGANAEGEGIRCASDDEKSGFGSRHFRLCFCHSEIK